MRYTSVYISFLGGGLNIVSGAQLPSIRACARHIMIVPRYVYGGYDGRWSVRVVQVVFLPNINVQA